MAGLANLASQLPQMQNMNPQDMMQKFQALQQVVALQQAQQAAGGNPNGSNMPNVSQQMAIPMPNPWASSTVTSASAMQGAMASPALMAQAAQMAAGMPMGPMGGFPMVSTPPLMHSQQQNMGISPPRAHTSSPNHPIACGKNLNFLSFDGKNFLNSKYNFSKCYHYILY